ncbi:hypothetical protein FNH22_30390 [Fulvivirga sp. M361]|uniref:hypothetical protein n=1 Tax=Fulvivirga sp. M361 TaxID=2594266 RepID=UPI00117B3F69|nr:hypothetical protein [Fulvivirga sp. M361]TRX47209.1 hypothetical protein FNH22_30390 [Fulvivirga sp. M361]
MIKKSEKYFGWTVIIISIIAYAVWSYIHHSDKKKVKQDHILIIGQIEKYHSVGSLESFHLTYRYYVKYKKYKRTIPVDPIFKGCEHDFSLCSDKKFWVAYEKGNPSNSLVNVYIELQDIESPIPPKTLEGFR